MFTRVAAELDPVPVDRQACHAPATTNSAVLAVGRPRLEPLGLTYRQYLVMPTLWDNAMVRPGVERKEPEHLDEVNSRINAAAPAVGALDSELDR